MKVKQILVCFAMVHGLSAYAAVNTGYQEATVMSSKLRFFYDSYTQTDKISPSSWYNRNISVGSTTISTKELAAATDATNALKKVVIDSTVQVYGRGGYTHVEFPYVGNDAQAALFAKTLMSTDKKILASTWKKGIQVKKNDQTLVGKVIAIFGTDGTYKNDDNSHVAIVLSVSANDITVINQNANVSAKSTDGIIRKHSLSFNGKKDALDAASYNVVELKVPAKSPLGLPVPTGAQFKSLNIPQKINLHDVWNVTLETTEYAKSVVLTLPDVNQKLQLVPSNNNTKWTLPRYTADKAGTMRQYFVDVFDKNDVRTAAIGNYLYVTEQNTTAVKDSYITSPTGELYPVKTDLLGDYITISYLPDVIPATSGGGSTSTSIHQSSVISKKIYIQDSKLYINGMRALKISIEGVGIALIAFDVFNTFISPTPDTGILGTALITAAKSGKFDGKVITRSMLGVDATMDVALSSLSKLPAVTPTASGYMNATKICANSCTFNLTTAEQSIASQVIKSGDITGAVTEKLLTDVAIRSGLKVVSGGKYGSNNGFDLVLQTSNKSTTFLIEGKQIVNGAATLNANAAGGAMQMSYKWIDNVILALPAKSEAVLAIKSAKESNTLIRAVGGVDRTTGKLVIFPVNP